ncbi:uncharacterized protein RAG0_07404 [Rhynchosporium agropyri]|uniref:Uncharacterized protein n=1 Tax=Rhynchosporium agropyri TaxID=914238 RepID=A0A1E1KLE4_9HELO|nr:uncharacterized protein RAG0_07404 [Rhynchosporium agropyri]
MVAVGKTKFPVPLFKDCKYGDPGAVIPMSSSPAPAKAKSASADYNRFVDSTGATLNSESMKKLLTFFGKAVSFQLLIQQTICTITDKGMNNRIYTIDDGDGRVDGQDMLDKGREVTVGSYSAGRSGGMDGNVNGGEGLWSWELGSGL